MQGDQCTSYRDQCLMEAVCRGRIDSIRNIISSYDPCYSQEWEGASDGYVLLLTAVQKKHTEIAKLLLQSGVEVNSRHESPYNTPLHFAVLNGDIELVCMLLHRGANINAKNMHDITPLHNAVETMKIEIIFILLHQGADINVPDISGITPLHLAIKNNSEQLTSILLYSGADVNGEGNNATDHIAADTGKGCTPLYLAVEEGNEELTKLLLSWGANVDAKVNNGKTCLHLATQHGYLNLTEHLLDYGADVNSVYTSATWDSCTPLHLAAYNGHKKIVELLLSRGADVNARDPCGGFTALSCAIKRGDIEVVELLLKCGANQHTTIGPEFVSPLQLAAKFGHITIAELLLKYGAKVSSKITHGIGTPLHAATGQLEIIKLLLKSGASVNSTDQYGLTALQYACVRGDEQIVTALLEHGADINSMYISASAYGCKPLHLAANKGHKDIIKMLLSQGADVNAVDCDEEWPPLYYAVTNSNIEVVELLLKCGATIESNFTTALHLAAEYGFITIAELLLKFGAKVDAIDEYGGTAFTYACDGGHEQIVTALLEHGADITVESNYNMLLVALDGFKVFCRKNHCLHSEYHDNQSHDIFTYVKIAHILKRHMIKMEVANLYVTPYKLTNEYVPSISSDDEEQSDFPNESDREIARVYYSRKAREERRLARNDFQIKCKQEIARMKSEKVGNTDITFYDILTKGVHQLTIHTKNENVVEAIRSDDYRKKFPIYASIINNNFRKGEKREEFRKQA